MIQTKLVVDEDRWSTFSLQMHEHCITVNNDLSISISEAYNPYEAAAALASTFVASVEMVAWVKYFSHKFKHDFIKTVLANIENMQDAAEIKKYIKHSALSHIIIQGEKDE